MKHYTQAEWLLFRQGLLAKEKVYIMEEHLAQCDQCLAHFLSLISEEEVKEADEFLSPDFSDKVINTVKGEKTIIRKSPHKLKEKQKNMFAYYVAAAAITLIFMSTGFFQSLIDTGPRIVSLAASPENRSREWDLNWSGKVVNKAALWLRDFETQNDIRRFEGETKK
ncbi:MAG: hypothetical protein JG781_221 [Peptococcaceae bacterium]|nr:hypothetical protein [Peptococcaceae bacterium]